ncbi:hypothetical protein ACFO4E_12090 [Nocardiopsis mangrovi]|uniref:LemA family protein n=1 Tax=Nocardiopsis mangrovi TaxID=1179818 RepID=A0ABV9DWV4_9ACTN
MTPWAGAGWAWIAAAAVVLIVLVSGYIQWRASRLDRLHVRVETATAALDAALARRAAAVLELAAAPGLEPASAVLLADAAVRLRRARDAGERELAESTVSRALRAVMEQPGFGAGLAAAGGDCDGELPAEAEAAAKRVYLARRFYNDAVAATRAARADRLVRALRLAGRAPLPEFFEMDDEPPRPSD